MRSMSRTLDQLADEVMELPKDARAQLMERLLLSFSDARESDNEVAQAWVEEAERRSQEMNRSGDPGIPAEEVFQQLRFSRR
jgi:putative addiction module component (TIGR02574 family)